MIFAERLRAEVRGKKFRQRAATGMRRSATAGTKIFEKRFDGVPQMERRHDSIRLCSLRFLSLSPRLPRTNVQKTVNLRWRNDAHGSKHNIGNKKRSFSRKRGL